MKCYHCQENDAEYRFFINYMGQAGEVHLCAECLEKLRQYAGAMFRDFQSEWPGLLGGWASVMFPQPEEERFDNPEPPREVFDPGDDIRGKRVRNELEARLRRAVRSENYEEAARLRDAICAAAEPAQNSAAAEPKGP